MGVKEGHDCRSRADSPDNHEEPIVIAFDDRLDLSSAVQHSLRTTERKRQSAM